MGGRQRAAVTMATSGEWGTDQVMTLTCDFATRNARCYWDRTVSLNLAAFTDFALEVFAPDPGAISSFHALLSFRRGLVWRSASLSQTGWQTLRFSKANFIPEGTPAGWDQIDGIRLSPWKGAARNTYLAVRQLRAFTPPVLLVRDDQSSNPTVVQQTIDRHLEWLGGYNIDCGVLSRAERRGRPARGKPAGHSALQRNGLRNRDGRSWRASWPPAASCMVYYLLPWRMEPLLGVRVTGWTPGRFRRVGVFRSRHPELARAGATGLLEHHLRRHQRAQLPRQRHLGKQLRRIHRAARRG